MHARGGGLTPLAFRSGFRSAWRRAPAWSGSRGSRRPASRLLLALVAVVPIALGWAAWRLGRAQSGCRSCCRSTAPPARWCDAYRELGEMSDAAAGSLEIEPRASGYLRCVLTEATPEESARFATALDELVAVADAPRYLVARPLPDPDAGAGALLGRVLMRAPAVPGPPPPGAGRPRAQQGARGGVRAGLVAPDRPDRAGVHAAHRRGPRAPAPRRRRRTAATRRSCATSGSEPACPAPRPHGPARRGRRRSLSALPLTAARPR